MKLSAMLLCDFYKVSHREQYPSGTEMVYSTWTPRESRIKGVNKVVFFGLQAFIKKYLINFFNQNFFQRSKEEVVSEYARIIKHTLGVANPHTKHIEDLHDLGYLPLEIKALPEGMSVPIRVPMFTVQNTDKRFFWLTNYIETLLSCEMWQPCTSATIAKKYKQLLNKYANETGGALDFVNFQGHDFSMRGMSSLESGAASGAGHLLSFWGTDTITGIAYAEEFYGANVEKEMVGTSIPATEHSVMCAHGENELETYRKLITEIYPAGFVSIASDTWDLWKVLSDVIVPLKEQILKRDGKTVVRPDSGTPEKILCGDPDTDNELARKGVVEVLWDIFGGKVNDKGFKELDPHIGCIYGDSITLERCEAICEGLKKKGFASTNAVYGIGSYTYQHNTRDTFGFAMKSTYCIVNGVGKKIFKDPVTDTSKVKKSQRGCVAVVELADRRIEVVDDLGHEVGLANDLLKPVFKDGKLLKEWTFAEVRERAAISN